MNVTAILLNYKRDKNVHRIIPALKAQTAAPEIVLINNGPPFLYEPTCAEDTPHETWTIPYNIGPFARWFVAYAQAGWLYIQDDDVVPGDDRFVEDLITLAMERPKAITGLFCRNIHKQPPYYLHKDEPKDGPTSYVKAICMALHRTTLGKVRIPAGDIGRNEDIHIGLEIGRGEPVHYVSAALRRRIIQLDQMGVALSHEPNHYTERDAYCGWWLRKEGLA
jgi:hypothetical protein